MFTIGDRLIFDICLVFFSHFCYDRDTRSWCGFPWDFPAAKADTIATADIGPRIGREKGQESVEWTAAQLGTLFPAVAAQMRGPLSNLGLAMQTLLPEEKRENAPDVDRTAARADQSYYALVRFLDNLSNVGWLTGNRKPRLQFCGIVRLVTDICVDCADLFEDQGRNLTFQVPPAERVYKVDQDAVRTAF